MSPVDVFAKINNAILDIQGSQYLTYEVPVKTLAKALSDPSLADINARLTAGVDLDGFLKSCNSAGRGLSARPIPWPEDENERLGLIILLVQAMGEDTNFAQNFGFHHFSNGSNKIIAGLHGFAGQILAPFARDYKLYAQSQPRSLRPMPNAVSSNKVFIVHGHDEAALQGLARFLEQLRLDPVVLKEKPDQGQTIIEKFESEADVSFCSDPPHP
jgi:hypothetical protein